MLKASRARCPDAIFQPCVEHYTVKPQSFYPRLASWHSSAVSAWFSRLRNFQLSERNEEAAFHKPPSALSMLELPTEDQVARGVALDTICVSTGSFFVFLMSSTIQEVYSAFGPCFFRVVLIKGGY